MSQSRPSQSLSERIYSSFDSHYESLEFTEEDVSAIVEMFDSVGFEEAELRERATHKVWTKYEPSSELPFEVKNTALTPMVVDSESLSALDSRYDTERKRYLRNIKRNSFPPELSQAIDELVENGIRGFQGTMLTDYALVDIILDFQDHLYEFTDAFSPVEVFHNDPDADDLLFDDASTIYYTLSAPWSMERRFDTWMCILSTGAAVTAIERAATIRAEESYEPTQFKQRIKAEGVMVNLAINPKQIPPALSY